MKEYLKKYQSVICIVAAVALLGAAAFCGWHICRHYAQVDEQTEAFAEIAEVVKAVLAELAIEKPIVKDKGRIMKTLMPRVKGKADGSLVNQVLGGFFA